jgi:hypothetical protein
MRTSFFAPYHNGVPRRQAAGVWDLFIIFGDLTGKLKKGIVMAIKKQAFFL